MQLYQFNKLSMDEKADFAWGKATLIESIRNELKAFVLYQTEEFFIEIEYHKQINEIAAIRAFKRGKHLEKYIDSVS